MIEKENLEVLIRAYENGARLANETDGSLLERLIARKQADGGIPVGAEIRILDNSEFPDDRTFRDAWEDLGSGSVQVNLPKARGIHMDKIRLVRNNELAKKDVEYMKALEADDGSHTAIAVEKQTLRDIPQTFDLTTDTPEELKEKWPDELPR